MPHEQHQAAVILGELGQGIQGPAHALVVADGDRLVEEGHDRVDDDEPGMGLLQGQREEMRVGGEAHRKAASGRIPEVEHHHAREVGAGGDQARVDGVADIGEKRGSFRGLESGPGWPCYSY